MPLKRRLTNIFIVAFLALTFIDTYPGPGAPWQRLQDTVDPLLDVTGLWQGRWGLFAPEVDRNNHHIEVIATFSDGEQTVWRSPDWQELSCLQAFLNIREMEYYERIRYPDNFAAWPAFAKFARRELIPPSETGAEIILIELAQVIRPLADLRLPPRKTREPTRRVFYRDSPPQ